jgi:hypothetical protein
MKNDLPSIRWVGGPDIELIGIENLLFFYFDLLFKFLMLKPWPLVERLFLVLKILHLRN